VIITCPSSTWPTQRPPDMASSQLMITELRARSGLTWHAAREGLRRASRRAVHHWATGGKVSSAHAETLAELSVFTAGATPVLIEGPMDAIAVSIASGGEYVGIAPLGTAFTESQARKLSRTCSTTPAALSSPLAPTRRAVNRLSGPSGGSRRSARARGTLLSRTASTPPTPPRLCEPKDLRRFPNVWQTRPTSPRN